MLNTDTSTNNFEQKTLTLAIFIKV